VCNPLPRPFNASTSRGCAASMRSEGGESTCSAMSPTGLLGSPCKAAEAGSDWVDPVSSVLLWRLTPRALEARLLIDSVEARPLRLGGAGALSQIWLTFLAVACRVSLMDLTSDQQCECGAMNM
jgi:hypothetical protein